MRTIEIFNTLNRSYTLKIDNIFLHSAYYPEETAEKFIKSNEYIYKNKKIIAIYGIGLGYHIHSLIKEIDDCAQVYIFDVDEEIYNIGKNNNFYDSFINDERIHIHIGYDKEFLDDFKSVLNQVNDVLIYKPSLQVLPVEFANFKNSLINFNMAKFAIGVNKEIMEENYKCNVKQEYLTMKDYYKTHSFDNERIIVVSAGPSLDDNIDYLKKMQHKIKIFCVGSALRTLINNNIIPYTICITDCSELVYNQIKGFENINVPLCFLSTASRWAVSNYNGPKYMFYNNDKDDDIIINTGKTVAISTIDIAAKGIPCEIILVGQDLAFINNKSHTSGINESYIDTDISNKVKGEKSLFKEVESVKGEILYTSSEYLNFKKYIEYEIENYPNIRFVNCSSGAKIKGTIFDGLHNYIDIL